MPFILPERNSWLLENAHLLWTYDESSPTGLVWAVNSGSIKKGNVAGSPNDRGYIQVKRQKIHYLAHHIVWVLHNGKIPPGLHIDHIDKNPGNNLITNLRAISVSENQRNRRSFGAISSKGVYFDIYYQRYKVDFYHPEKGRIFVGTFKSEEEAAAAWQREKSKLNTSQ